MSNDNQKQTQEEAKQSRIQRVSILEVMHELLFPTKLEVCECRGYYCEDFGVIVFLGTPGGTLILQEGIYPIAIIRLDEETEEVIASAICRVDLGKGINGLFVRKFRNIYSDAVVVWSPGKLLALLAHGEKFGGELYGCWDIPQYMEQAETEEGDMLGRYDSEPAAVG